LPSQSAFVKFGVKLRLACEYEGLVATRDVVLFSLTLSGALSGECDEFFLNA